MKTSGRGTMDQGPPQGRLSVPRILVTAAAALLACWLLGWATQAVILVVLAPDLCWHPGASRNIGIAELPCP
jgi:hypothetical protein